MRKLSKFLTIVLVSLFLRQSSIQARAVVADEFDPTADYIVHTLPNSAFVIEQKIDIKNVPENKLLSDQKTDNKLINKEKEIRIFNDKNPSTKDEQQSNNSFENEDTLLHEKNSESSSDGCIGEHNSAKSYSVSSAARLLTTLLKIGPNHLLSQFHCDDPNSSYLPEKARDIYKKSVTWTPHKSVLTQKITNDYLQCVTFVFMSYEMADKPITKQGRTNASDFLASKYTGKNGQFTKFKSAETTQLPEEGDIVVWSPKAIGTVYGHVGVVLEVRTDRLLTQDVDNLDLTGQPKKKFGTILVANSNASQVVYEYQYSIDVKTQVVTLGKLAGNWTKVPDYWLRIKE